MTRSCLYVQKLNAFSREVEKLYPQSSSVRQIDDKIVAMINKRRKCLLATWQLLVDVHRRTDRSELWIIVSTNRNVLNFLPPWIKFPNPIPSRCRFSVLCRLGIDANRKNFPPKFYQRLTSTRRISSEMEKLKMIARLIMTGGGCKSLHTRIQLTFER